MDDVATREQLISLLRPEPDLSILESAEAWEQIRVGARKFGLEPLVAFIARKHVSDAARKWCDSMLVGSWRRHARCMGDLAYAVSVLAEAGIRAMPLKGPFLAHRCYEPPFLRRPATDLDVAVRGADLEKACEALAKAGYALEDSIERFRMVSHEVKLIHPGRTRLEIHFRLSHGPLGIAADEVFDRAIEGSLPGGQPVALMRPADELMFLILHLASDRFHSLFHQYEAQHLWRSASAETREEAIRAAVSGGFAGAFSLADIGFRLRWNLALIPEGMKLPRTWFPGRVDRKLYESLEGWMEPERRLATRLRGRWLDLQMTDSLATAARLVGAMIRVSGMRVREKGWKNDPHRPFRLDGEAIDNQRTPGS